MHSPWKGSRQVPVPGAPAQVEVFADYEDALDGIERTSHIVIVSFLDRANRDALRTKPQKLSLTAPEWGVFASRSPARPNPIGISATRLVSRHGLRLDVNPLDLADGTPVLDIKSYSPGWDSVFSACSIRRVPSTMLAEPLLVAFLQRDLDNFLGDNATSDVAQQALRALVQAVGALAVDPRDSGLQMHVRSCGTLAEALMGMTGACLSNGRLVLDGHAGDGEVRFCYKGNVFVVRADE